MAITAPSTVATDEQLSSTKQNVLTNAVIDMLSLIIGGQALEDYSNGDTITVGGAEIATGTYTGNGSATQAITGVGFQPDVVFVHQTNTGGTRAWGSNAYSAGNAFFPAGAYSGMRADHITALDADGFTVGDGTGTANQLNINAATYAFVAWKGS